MTFYYKYFTRCLLIKDFLNINKTYNPILINNLSTFYSKQLPNKVNNDGNKSKTKKISLPKISLYMNDKMSVTTLEEAEKLAIRRDFKLMKLSESSQTERATYKLVTKSQWAAASNKDDTGNNSFKGEKVLALSSKIAKHDLDSKIKNISKWISKNLEVKVSISGESDASEKVYKMIETGLSDSARLLQKRQKGNEIRFQIIPPKKEKQDSNNIKKIENPSDQT